MQNLHPILRMKMKIAAIRVIYSILVKATELALES